MFLVSLGIALGPLATKSFGKPVCFQDLQKSPLITIKKIEHMPTDALLTALSFDRTRTMGIAVGGSKSDDPGTIFRTTNGGKNWSHIQTAKGARLYGAAHVSEKVMVVVGLGGLILRSSDGGESWKTVRTGKEWLSGVAFNSPTMGFAIGATGPQAILLRTLDGGKTWNNGPKIPRVCQSSALRAIRFRDKKNGVIVGTDGAVLTTKDGGTTWAGSMVGKGYLRGIAFQGERTIWISGGPGVLLKSSDFGTSWETRAFLNKGKLNSINFANSEFGWITSMDGHIYETSDGGQTWHSIFLEKGKHLTGILAPSPGHSGFVVGSDACVLELMLQREAVVNHALEQFVIDGGLAAYELIEASILPDSGRQAVIFYFFAAQGAIGSGHIRAAKNLIVKFENACKSVAAISPTRTQSRSQELRKMIFEQERNHRKARIEKQK